MGGAVLKRLTRRMRNLTSSESKSIQLW